MITKEDSKKIKRIIGSKYSTKILEYFSENDYTRESGEPYSDQDIRNFFAGRHNLQLENYVLEAAAHFKKIREDLEKKREKVLNGL